MINTLLSENIIIVASAGNNIGQEVDYPAKYTNVISVGSIDKNGKRGRLQGFARDYCK